MSCSAPPNSDITIVDVHADDSTRRFAPHERMVSAIAAITRKNGGCLAQDLNAIGFSPEEVVEHWHVAKALAALMTADAEPAVCSEAPYAKR